MYVCIITLLFVLCIFINTQTACHATTLYEVQIYKQCHNIYCSFIVNTWWWSMVMYCKLYKVNLEVQYCYYYFIFGQWKKKLKNVLFVSHLRRVVFLYLLIYSITYFGFFIFIFQIKTTKRCQCLQVCKLKLSRCN